MERVSRGNLSPVFFGSALTNFGVETFLEHFLKMTTSPLPRNTTTGMVDPFYPRFQRVCLQDSGKYEQGAPRPYRIYAYLFRQV